MECIHFEPHKKVLLFFPFFFKNPKDLIGGHLKSLSITDFFPFKHLLNTYHVPGTGVGVVGILSVIYYCHVRPFDSKVEYSTWQYMVEVAQKWKL